MSQSSSSKSLLSREPTQSTKAAQKRDAHLSAWSLETLAAVFSIACIAGMIAVLREIDGKEYRQWRVANVDIAPNTLLAILSTFAKSSLLLVLGESLGQLKWIYFQQRPHRLMDLQTFDEASRGPLGSLQLLWSVNGQAVVASTGAILTVLALAMDPLTQQLLAFPTRSVILSNTTADIGAAKLLLGYSHPDAANSIDAFKPYAVKVGRAVLSGILGNEIRPPFTCSSGDCDWPAFNTLGICTECMDATHQLTRLCPEESYYGNATDPNEFLDSITRTCNYTFPMNAKSYGMPDSGDDYDINMNITYRSYPQSPGSWIRAFPLQNITFRSTRDLPLLGQVMSLSSSRGQWRTENATVLHNPELADSPTGVRCNISLCEQAHATTKFKLGALQDPTTQVRELSYDYGYCQYNSSGYIEGCPVWSIGQAPVAPVALNVSRPDDHPGIYWLTRGDTDPLTAALEESFSVESQEFGGEQSYSAVEQLLYANMSAALDRIAVALTNLIRQIDTEHQATGHVRQTTTFVRVNWWVLIYPTALSIIVALYLAVSICFSSGPETRAWKNSILPLLFHNIDFNEATGTKELNESARNMRAQLVGTNRLPRFKVS